MPRQIPSTLPLALLALIACSSTDDKKTAAQSANAFVMTSDPFTLGPGDEKYMCYTTTVDTDTAFHAFSIGAHPSVHHMFFARTLAPEQEGPHECPVLFKPTWLPVFTTGRGATRLDLPEGSAFDISKGTQLLMQLHLVNTSPDTVTDAVDVRAETMDPSKQQYHAALFPFGTTVFDLPPNQPSTVTHDCTMDKDMDAFVAFAHMHLLGKEMALQVGKDAASLVDVYRNQYDFNNQQLEPVSFSLHAGDFTRVTCSFQNDTPKHVTYGESTFEEMCFFSIFIKDGQSLDGHCVDVSRIFGPPPDAGVDSGP
jgi:hypothetical protein